MENLPRYLKKINGSLWLTEDDRDNLKISYRIRDIIYFNRSSFQDIMIADSYDFGPMLVLDGVVQTTSVDGFIYNEMISHIPLSFHPNPQSVLIIGGGDCGAACEVAKYTEIQRIDMVEIDEMVVKACKEHLPEVSGGLADPRVNFIYEDGTKFVKGKKDAYDIIIVDSSDPVGPAQVLFELPFYQNLYNCLKEDGIIVCQSQSPVFNEDILKQTFSRIQSLFPITKLYTAIVPTYPGGFWSFTLGSKKYSTLYNKLGNKDTRYINQDILTGAFQLPQWIKTQLNL